MEASKKKVNYSSSEYSSSSDDSSSSSSTVSRKRKRSKDSKTDRKRKSRKYSSDSDDSGDRHRKKKDKKKKKHKKKSSKRKESDTESEESDHRPSKRERFTTDSDEERKLKKEKKKVEKVAKALGYSNDVNPFGDANLLTPFEWGKKRQNEKSKATEGNKEEEETNRFKLMTEIEKVRKRRQDREAELAEMERLRDEEQRLREIAAFGDWQHKEEEFHLEQTMERARLRLLDYRDRPIDRCIKNFILILAAERLMEFHNSHHDASHRDYELKELSAELDLARLSIESENPIDIIEKLDAGKLQQLADELELHLQLDKEKGGNRMNSFWTSLKLAVQSRLKRMRQSSDGRISSFHESIAADVASLLHGKSEKDLNLLENDIRKNLAPGKVVDVEYWGIMLEEVELQRAKAVVIKEHIAMVQQFKQLHREVRDTGLLDKSSSSDQKHHRHRDHHAHSSQDDFASRDDNAVRSYMQDSNLDEDIVETELKMADTDEIDLPTALSASVEALLEDKYRPRKPRYFNRVRTGWDRNKYNLTHYDSDNPPPVRIQGYKFTIFYPDLIDKTKTPRYFIEPCPDCDNHEFLIIRFHAGPPYEDIAFKIINREWDTHRRSGFLNVFDRGILQLHFNFKRAFYRR